MNRGAFRLQAVLWSFIALLQLVMLTRNVLAGDPWDWPNALNLVVLVLAVANVGWLLYVRRRDSSFWDEEEARKADWDRRGRAL